MGDPRRSPKGDEKIGAAYVLKVIGPRFPMRSVVLLRPIVEIADIVDRYLVAVEVRPGGSVHISLPVPIVRGSDRQPPAQNQRKAGKTRQPLEPGAANHCNE